MEFKPGFYWWKYKDYPQWCGVMQVYGVPPFCNWSLVRAGDKYDGPSVLKTGQAERPYLPLQEIEIGPYIEEPPHKP
jgi:hypothetical protein